MDLSPGYSPGHFAAQPVLNLQPPRGDSGNGTNLLVGRFLGLARLGLDTQRAQAQPASSDFFVRPRGDNIEPIPHNEMKVIGKNREPEHIDAKVRRQLAEPRFEPLLAMIEVLSRYGIVPSEMAASHAPMDAMPG
jgi:hypothetical protein